jgi:hypothetical protein
VDRFVVCTGRCGSTLLSRMLAESPEVASLFEFFNGLEMGRRFGDEPADGEEFAGLISQKHPFVTMVLSRGYEVPEIIYPFSSGSRFQKGDGLPWIAVSALPRLSDDPDRLYDETLAFAKGMPKRHLREQYRALFDWWTERTGRRVWIERSGSSFDYLESLERFFPRARFLHIHRDGRESALSMRDHHAFRLAVSLMAQHQTQGKTIAELGALETGQAVDDTDPISRLLEGRPDAVHFGRFWSGQVLRGYRGVRLLDSAQYAELRFEDLLAEPGEELARIARFFELDPDADRWRDRAAALIGKVPALRHEALPPDERQRLEDACAPGNTLLGRS